MKSKRTHPYKIKKDEARKAWGILNDESRPIIDRLRGLLEIKTGKTGSHRIGQGFRNDIMMIIKVAEEGHVKSADGQ